MDYKKLYKRALERAKKVHDEHRAQPFDVMLKVFPELKESKDERIRKELIRFHKSTVDIDGIRGDDIVSWLEKQGEKSIIIDVDKMVLKYSQTMDGDFGLPINCQIRAYRQGINDTLRLEKQGDQKPYGQREECSDCQVNYAGECKGSCAMKKDEWVPKKGDVCKPKKGGNNILLCDQDGIAFSFVEYVKNGGYAGGKIYIPTLLKEYELVEPKDYSTFDISFNAKDSELQEASYYIPKGYHAEIDGDKVIIKKGEQKPAWSEDDEDMHYKAMAVINRLYAEGKDYVWSTKTLKKLFYWLKSLKDRIKGE